MEDFAKKPPLVDDPLEPVAEEERLWALLAHLAFLVGLAVLGPLIIWLIKKDASPFIEDQAKEALNFQLTCLVISLVAAATCVGWPLAVVVAVVGVIYSVLAGIDSYKGRRYRYPYTLRMIQ
jgi:uncharacterized protein